MLEGLLLLRSRLLNIPVHKPLLPHGFVIAGYSSGGRGVRVMIQLMVSEDKNGNPPGASLGMEFAQ